MNRPTTRVDGLLEREIEVFVHRDREFLAGRDHEVEVDALLAVDDAAHAGTRMADVGDVAAARGARACWKPQPQMPSREVVEAHAVRAADHEPGGADLREHALAQRRLAVVRRARATT